MAHLAEVATIYESNAREICAMLRQAADNIELEADEGFSPTVAIVAVSIAESGGIKIYGWGDTDDLRALGLLERGKHQLLATVEDATQ